MPLPRTPALTVDCVAIDGERRLLLIRRKNPPHAGKYALPGGFVDVGETVEDACRRELMEETGIKAGRLVLIGVYSNPGRDPRRHTCSVAFLTRIARAAKGWRRCRSSRMGERLVDAGAGLRSH
jgi:8-oxo-dGTP diphosphatase